MSNRFEDFKWYKSNKFGNQTNIAMTFGDPRTIQGKSGFHHNGIVFTKSPDGYWENKGITGVVKQIDFWKETDLPDDIPVHFFREFIKEIFSPRIREVVWQR